MSWLAEGNTEAVSLGFQGQEVLWTYGHKVCGSLKVVSMPTKEHLSRGGTKQQGEYNNSPRGAGPSSVFAHPEVVFMQEECHSGSTNKTTIVARMENVNRSNHMSFLSPMEI